MSIGYFNTNEPSQRIVEKLGFQKLGTAPNAAIRCLNGTKLDRHEYILTSPDALRELDVFWCWANPAYCLMRVLFRDYELVPLRRAVPLAG